jgi:hypothetical protein
MRDETIAGYLEALRDLGKPIPVEVAGAVAAEARYRNSRGELEIR